MNTRYLLHTLTTSFFVFGMVFLWAGSTEVLEGEESPISSQGSILMGDIDTIEGMSHPSADISVSGSTEFLVGILLILVGFFFHAVLVSHKAPLHLPKRKKKGKNTGFIEWFYFVMR